MSQRRKSAVPWKVLAAGLALLLGSLTLATQREEPPARQRELRSSDEPDPRGDLLAKESVSSTRYGSSPKNNLSREQGWNLPYRLGPHSSLPPSRVVSLSPALTEIVIALGAAQRLVGVTRFCDDPEVSGIDRIGGFVDPSIEAILSTAPDLILAEPSPGNRDAILHLVKLNLAVLVVPHGGVAEMRAALLAIAKYLGVPARGQSLLESFDQSIEEVRRAAASKPPRRAALVYGRDPLVLAGPGSFGDELLRLAGGENIANDSKVPYANYPLELLVAKAPEVVIETPMTAGQARSRVPLHESARHVVITGDALLRPSPALAEAARLLLVALHPDIEIEDEMISKMIRPSNGVPVDRVETSPSDTTGQSREQSP